MSGYDFLSAQLDIIEVILPETFALIFFIFGHYDISRENIQYE